MLVIGWFFGGETWILFDLDFPCKTPVCDQYHRACYLKVINQEWSFLLSVVQSPFQARNVIDNSYKLAAFWGTTLQVFYTQWKDWLGSSGKVSKVPFWIAMERGRQESTSLQAEILSWIQANFLKFSE